MKYLKLFENFSEEEKPLSITIELTDEFKDHMKQSSETTSGNK